MVVCYLVILTLLDGAAVHDARAQAPSAAAAADPDALYRDRERPASALAAERIWAGQLAADAGQFEAASKLAKVRYWLGTNGPGTAAEKKRWLEAGMAAARAAIAARASAPDGHFWLAANMGGLAEAHGLRQGIRYRTPIREALEKALAADAAYLHGSPDRALGRWYFKVPGLFGGDLQKSEAHLRKALAYNPQSIISLLFLAETLEGLGKVSEARTVLTTALDAPADPEWAPEDARFKAQARALLVTWARQ